MVFPPESHSYINVLPPLRGTNWANSSIKGDKLGVKGDKLGKSSTSTRGEIKGDKLGAFLPLKGDMNNYLKQLFVPLLE